MSPPSTNRLVGTIELVVTCQPGSEPAETRLKNAITVTADDGVDLAVELKRVVLKSSDILQGVLSVRIETRIRGEIASGNAEAFLTRTFEIDETDGRVNQLVVIGVGGPATTGQPQPPTDLSDTLPGQ